jgi:ApaG protein
MKAGKKFSSITNKIQVSVQPVFLPDQTIVKNNFFVWAYNIEIENHGEDDVQLKFRHWKVIDEHGGVHEVSGEGVVGEQPIIAKDQRFQYSSGTYLPTPSGIMQGIYEMENLKTNKKFKVEIPAFSLDSPFSKQQLS